MQPARAKRGKTCNGAKRRKQQRDLRFAFVFSCRNEYIDETSAK